jgi:predicted dehydrogenase
VFVHKPIHLLFIYKTIIMKKIKLLLVAGACVVLSACSPQAPTVHTTDKGTQWEWNEGTIVVKSPERPAGQKSVIGLTAPKMEVVRVGFVGLGMRGPGAVSRFTHIPGTQIVALCDYDPKRAEACQNILKKASMPKAAIYSGETGYEELCKRDDIDLVYIAADWLHHFPIAKCALENGKHVAIEVPSAMNLQECWDLVNLSETTRKHCFILENCCYDWFEMNTLNMAQNGVFGEVIRAQGAYIHNLSDFWDYYWKNGENDKLGWRLEFNMRHRGDVYATHGLGPVAQVLDIHRGDRMKTLTAMDTKSVVGKGLVEAKTGSECTNFRNGDHTTTMIRTENGKNKNIVRKKLTQEEITREVVALQDLGHKRLLLEAGEHPKYNPIEYILESIKTIYSIKHKNGQIRRLNVNIAATTVENYRKLHDAEIGTYQLFQETYHPEEYKKLHPKGPKADYAWHTEAHDRAMEGGIDDVGLGVPDLADSLSVCSFRSESPFPDTYQTHR